MGIRTDEVMIVNGRLKQAGKRFRYMRYNRSAVFECECGVRFIADWQHVKQGSTLSCGCLHRELTAISAATHGYTRRGRIRPEYRAWAKMRARCNDPNDKQYCDYGGRGITVCERWQHSFENFIADMGDKPEGLALDRENNSLGYSPDNCRWTTNSRNNRNKRSNRILTFNGESLCCADWAERVGLTKKVLWYRLNAGWSVEKALTTPARKTSK